MMKKLAIAAAALWLPMTMPAHAVTEILPPVTTLTGIFCDHTCLGFQPGDNTQVLFDGLPWPIGSELTGAFKLTIAGNVFSFTADGGTLTWTAPNPHFAIVPAPAILNLPAGTLELVINGLPSSFGYAGPMIEQLCDIVTTGVPEPTTWALMLVGFAGLGFAFRKRRSMIRSNA